MNAVVLNSGGVESLVTLASAVEKNRFDEIHTLFINYGQKTFQKEMRAAANIAKHYKVKHHEMSCVFPWNRKHDLADSSVLVIDPEVWDRLYPDANGDKYIGGSSHVVPYRNVVFLSLAASLAQTVGAVEIFVGFDYPLRGAAKEGRSSEDKSPRFVTSMESALYNACEYEWNTLKLTTPVQHAEKHEIIRMGNAIKVPFEKTWSCYNNLPLACGVCGPCEKRRVAFERAGRTDPVRRHCERYIREYLE